MNKTVKRLVITVAAVAAVCGAVVTTRRKYK